MHNSNHMAGQKKKFARAQGQKLYVLPIQRVQLSRKKAKSAKFQTWRAK